MDKILNVKSLTWGEDIIICKYGNRVGTNFGTRVSSRSSERRAKHLKAPRTAKINVTICKEMKTRKLHIARFIL